MSMSLTLLVVFILLRERKRGQCEEGQESKKPKTGYRNRVFGSQDGRRQGSGAEIFVQAKLTARTH
jgi:hypothetical protein